MILRLKKNNLEGATKMFKKPMMVEAEIKIKAYEIDSMGIVSNIVYVKWFEDLRHVFLEKYYPYKEMMKSKISPMLMKTEIEYIAPLTIYDNPIGRSWVSKMGKMKWEFVFEIYSGSTTYCIGKQMGCFFDLERKRVTPIPERMLIEYKEETAK